MEFRSVQGMERLRPQQDGMVELLGGGGWGEGGIANN